MENIFGTVPVFEGKPQEFSKKQSFREILHRKQTAVLEKIGKTELVLLFV